MNRASKIAEKTPFQASVSQAVYESYNDYITDRKKRNNQFNIEKQFQNPLTNKPVIPGSSLKGSIVTAWLNALASTQQNYNPNNHEERDALKRIEEKIKKENKVSDVFQKLKISDAELSSETTMRIIQPTMNHRNKVKNNNDDDNNSSKLSILEIIPRGAVFKGTITIAEEEQASFWAEIQNRANQFFKKELKIEEDDTRFVYNEFYENLQRKLRPSDCESEHIPVRHASRLLPCGTFKAVVKLGRKKPVLFGRVKKNRSGGLKLRYWNKNDIRITVN